jgi:hypothetical protein
MERMTIWRRRQAQKDKPVMSLPNAAKQLNLSRQGISYYIIKGRLKGFKWAGKWYLYVEDVNALKSLRETMKKK